jgi:hypothetical protein
MCHSRASSQDAAIFCSILHHINPKVCPQPEPHLDNAEKAEHAIECAKALGIDPFMQPKG